MMQAISSRTQSKLRLRLSMAVLACALAFVQAQAQPVQALEPALAAPLKEQASKLGKKKLPPAASYTPERWAQRIIELIDQPLPSPEELGEELGVEWQVRESKNAQGERTSIAYYAAGWPWEIAKNEKTWVYNKQMSTMLFKDSYRSDYSFYLYAANDFCISETKIKYFLHKNDWKFTAIQRRDVPHQPFQIFYRKVIKEKEHRIYFNANAGCLNWVTIWKEVINIQ